MSDETTVANPLQNTPVIDVDVHFSWGNPEMLEKISKHMDEPWASYIHPDTGHNPFPSPGYPKKLGGRKDKDIENVVDADSLREPLCEEFGVDYPLINPLAMGDLVLQKERGIQDMRAYNNVLIEDFLDEEESFYGVGSLTTRSPAHAAEEVDRLAAEDRIVGVMFLSGTEFGLPPGDPELDIVYQAIDDNDLVPVYHPSELLNVSSVIRQLDRMVQIHSLNLPWSAMFQLVSVIGEGVPEKFPDLDFVFLEGGIGWIPYMMARLNKEYAQWKTEGPMLRKSPEEYVRESCYFGTQPLGEFNDPSHMMQLVEMIGADRLMFATDFPHFDFDHPTVLNTMLRTLSETQRAQILHQNAADVFGINA